MKLGHARMIIKNFKDVLIPMDYKNLCKEVGIKEETIKLVEEEEKKINLKSSLILLITFIIVLTLAINLLNFIKIKNFSLLSLYLEFQMISILSCLIGTYFLGKGFYKNKYRVALEASTIVGANPVVIKNILQTKHDTLIGFVFIISSVFCQLTALYLSLFFI